MVGALHVAMQRRRLKLGEQKDAVDLGINAVGDRDIDEPILPGQWNRGFAPLQRKGRQPGAPASTHDYSQGLFASFGHSSK
jgi:hypothetical protein